MKFKITFKDPDGVLNSISEAVDKSLDEMVGVTEDEKEALRDIRCDVLREHLKKWIQYDEYVTIEFDTEAKTAIVIQRNY